MKNPIITVAVCSYNRYPELEAAIESLQAQSLGAGKYEILVVDNSPDHDLSAEMATRYNRIANLSWIVEKTPGLSNARNVGTRLSKGRFIAFMDDDAVADRSWLERILAAFDEFGDRASVVGGRVEPIWEAPRPSWLHDDFLGHLSVVNWDAVEARATGEREWLAGTNISFRVEALKSIGGFSTHLGRTGVSNALLSNEETDVCNKLKAAGQLVIYAPDAKVGHRVEAARMTQEWFRRRITWQAISDYLQNGSALYERVPQHWKNVVQFASLLPPRDRSLRALCVPLQDPVMFKAQMSALYNYTISLLAGFNGVEI